VGLIVKRRVLSILVGVALCLGCVKKPNITCVPRTGTASRMKGQGSTAKTILVIMPSQLPAERVWVGMKDELTSDFDLVALRLDDDASVSAMASAIRQTTPACVVLMNNSNVRLYTRYQQSLPDGTKWAMDACCVMTSFLRRL
jgi:hypothetical protein